MLEMTNAVIHVNTKQHDSIKVFLNKKLSYCWETVRRESIPRIAVMNVEMTT